MKRGLAAIGFSVLLLGRVSLMNAAGDRGLVFRYDFAQGSATVAHDASGNGHDGKIEGGGFTTRDGHRALAANGSSTSIVLGSDPALSIRGDMTIEAWVRSDDNSGRDCLILGDTAGLAVNRNFGFSLDRGFVRFEHGDGRNSEAFTSERPLAVGVWEHVAVVAEFPYLYIYLNGREASCERMQFDIVPTKGGPRCAAGWWAGHLKGGLDDLRLYRRALSPGEIAAAAGVGGAGIEAPTIAVSPEYLLGFRRIVVDLACRGELPEQMEATAALLDASGQEAEKGSLKQLTPSRPGSGRANCRLEMPGASIKPGRYEVVARLTTPEGKLVAETKRAWDVPAIPSWVGMHEKTWDTIPPPYFPLKTSAEAGGSFELQPIGRRYDLGEFPLPTQITTGGKPILAAPIRLAAKVDGKPVEWHAAKPSLKEHGARRDVITARAEGAGLDLSATATMAYDGFLRFDCKLAASKATHVDGLTLEIPLKAEHASLFYYYPYQDSASPHQPGALDPHPEARNAPLAADPGRERVLFSAPFRPILWLGDNDRGLAWFCESDRNWYLRNPDRAVEIVRRGKEVVVRLHLIDEAGELRPHKPLDYSFALQATPVKPVGKTCWDYRFTSTPFYGKDYELLTGTIKGEPQLDYLASHGARTLILANWTKILCYPAPIGHEEQLREMVRACHERGMRVIVYIGYQISELAPEWPLLGHEVVTLPLMRNPDMYPGEKPQIVDMICNRSVWPDRIIAGIGKLMDDYDIDGVYLDSPNMPFACTNQDHGCGYRRPDGTLVGTYPIYATREFFQRVYDEVKARKPDGIVDNHVFSCMNASTLAYTTSYWIGEQMPTAPKGYIPAVLPLARFRAMCMGRQWGSPAELLHYRLGGYSPCLAMSLLHDVPVRAHASVENLDLMSTIWKAMDTFGREHARFVPYWQDAGMVGARPEGVCVSLYLHPRSGVLAVVSNLGKKTAEAEVSFDLGKVGLAGKKVEAVDALDGKPLELRGGTISLRMPSMGWRLVRLRPEGASSP